MNDEEYIKRKFQNFFSEILDDDVKSDTICFRVSKNIKKQFVAHANGKYGSSQKAMEKIFKDYMETVIYKRGKVNGVTALEIPKFDSKDNLEEIKNSNIKIKKINLVNFGENNFKINDNISKDVIVKSFSSDDSIIVPFFFNNYLDNFIDGVYSSVGDEYHSGLVMSYYNGIDFYILFKFSNLKQLDYFSLISKKQAYELALNVDNKELAEIIIKFNDDNIELDNINYLKSKKIQLENELSVINEKLKKMK